jgi:hypothetical protein
VALLEGHEPPPPFVKPTTTTGNDAAPAANDETQSKPIPKPQRKKGETRVLLPLSVLEEAVFGSRSDPERAFGRRRNRAFRGVREDGEWRSVDMEDDDSEEGGGRAAYAKRPEPISTWEGAEDFDGDDLEVDGGVRLLERRDWDDDEGDSVGAEPETPELAAKRRAGQKKAEEREFVRCVVRRAVVFGVEVEGWEEMGGNGGGGRKGRKGKGRRDEDSEEDAVQSEVKPRRKCEAVMSGQVVEPSFAKGDWSVRWREE